MDLMTKNTPSGCSCKEQSDQSNQQGLTSITPFILSSPAATEEDQPCCGKPAGPPSSPYEKAGYQICQYVDGFVTTKTGFVPQVKTSLTLKDHAGTALTRMNIGRYDYKVTPGLYAIGNPDENAPVFVTANFKLSFDHVRKELSGRNVFILVLDTRGINVWCAAGKGTFGTEELVNRIRLTQLSQIVRHRNLIVPQLGATGISAIAVKKQSGFAVTWGPVHSRDLARFIDNGMIADKDMRMVTFSLVERLILIPVELSLALKPSAIVFLACLLISGIGPGIYSFSAAFSRGFPAILTLISGIIAGAIVAPALLPKLPGTMFSIKGIQTGLGLSIPTALVLAHHTGFKGVTALILTATALSSYLAMNFTGTSPFTSPTGVEKEMRMFIPIQAFAVIIGTLLWILSAF